MGIRVAIAEDSYLVREALEHLLEPVPEIDLVASCADLEALRERIEADAPEVVLTDIRMPPTGTDEGVQLAAELRDSKPGIGVVVLSQYSEPEFVVRLFERGSDGRAYLLKERVADRDELLGAIRAVRDGGSVIDPKVVEVMVRARARAESSPLQELTPRELEVLALVAEGSSNSAVAESLVLTKRAVEKHINSIFLKLGLTHDPDEADMSKRVKAVLMYLADDGLVGPDRSAEQGGRTPAA